MTKPSDQNHFTQELAANTSKISKVLIWVAAVLGCGCLSIFIIGILAAIALPSFFSKACKGKQSEGKTYIGTMTKGQQIYRLEQPTFANSIGELEIGIKPETVNYSYKIVPQPDQSKSVMMTAVPKTPVLKSYTGAVFAIKKGKEDFTTVIVICESDRATTTPPSMPAAPKDELTPIECPAGSRSVTR